MKFSQPETHISDSTTIHPKKLSQLAKKCQRMLSARAGARRRHASEMADECCSTVSSVVADEGHCVMYTTDGTRFEVPLAYLGTTVFAELLRMSEEEFGFASGSDGGRIMLPCDATVMEYVLCLVRRSASTEMEAAFLNTMVMPCHYHAELHLGVSQHYDVCSS